MTRQCHYAVEMSDGTTISVVAADQQDAKARAIDTRLAVLRVSDPSARWLSAIPVRVQREGQS